MIQRVADRGEPAGARALGRWLASRARHRAAPRARGLAPARAPRHSAGGAEPRGLGERGDATGSFNVGISFPGALELRDIVLACISVDAGLRAVNLVTAVAPETSRRDRASARGRTGDSGGADRRSRGLAVTSKPRAAARIELGRALPEGFTLAMPYLRRPLAVAKPAAPAGVVPPAPRGQLATLLDAPAYATWTFGGAELSMPRSLAGEASADLASAASGGAHGASRSRRKRGSGATRGNASSSERGPSPAFGNVARGPQPRRRQGDRGAWPLRERFCPPHGRALDGGEPASWAESPALRRTRRIQANDRRDYGSAATSRGDSRPRRGALSTARESERARRPGRPPHPRADGGDGDGRRRSLRRRILARRERAGAFARDGSAADRAVGGGAPAHPWRRHPDPARAANLRGNHRTDRDSRVGGATRRSARQRGSLVRRGGVLAPMPSRMPARSGIGRPRTVLRSRPSGGLDLVPSSAESGRSAGGLALRQHLARRLDERIVVADSFLEALERLGPLARGDGRSRLRRAGELLERLRALRREVERIEEDPAWLYALVEETEQLVREVRTLHKHLLGAALGRLVPKPRQFESFQPYPAGARRVAAPRAPDPTPRVDWAPAAVAARRHRSLHESRSAARSAPSGRRAILRRSATATG